MSFNQVLQLVFQQCRDQGIPMLGQEKAEFMATLVRESRPDLVVECGTAIGYSGLWIARELQRAEKGNLITIELNPDRADQARTNFTRAGVAELVEVRVGEAEQVLDNLDSGVTVDFAHIDNEFNNYYPCFRAIEPNLAEEAILLADNVSIGEAEMFDYLEFVRANFETRTQWFDINLPWVKKDVMEVSIYRSKRHDYTQPCQ